MNNTERTVLASGELTGNWYESRGYTERRVAMVEIFVADHAGDGYPSVKVQVQSRIDLLSNGRDYFTGNQIISHGPAYGFSWDGNAKQIAKYALLLRAQG